METKRSNTGALIGGAILIGVGLLTLIGQFIPNFWGALWPFFIIGPGLLFFVAMLAGGRSAAPFAIPGSILTMIGLILFFQNVTGHWESWAYSWSLIIVAVGLGISITGAWSGNATQRKSGWDVTKIGLILFVIFGSFFEMIFSGFTRNLMQYIFPAVLVLIGLYLVLARSGVLKARPVQAPEKPQEPPQSEEM